MVPNCRHVTAEEDRLHCERLLGEALSLFHQGRLDVSLEGLTYIGLTYVNLIA